MTVVLVTLDGGSGLAAVPQRPWDAVLARLFSALLDNRLAAGVSPESSRLLAVRSLQLTSPRMRRRLARCWEELAVRARHPSLLDPRVPIARSQVDAAADEIQRIADLLRSPSGLSARGVAIAASLLTEPDSPVRRFGGGGGEVAAAVARAVAEM